MAKRVLNWTEIEARYKAGERPADIAKDYKCCTSAQIRSKAHRESWHQQRKEIRDEIVSAVVSTVTADVLNARSRALSELNAIAYSDIRDYLTIDPDTGGVRSKGFDEMPEGASRAIKKVREHRTIKETKNGESILSCTFEFELYDKRAAIMDIARIEGFEKPTVDENNDDEVTLTINRQGLDVDEE